MSTTATRRLWDATHPLGLVTVLTSASNCGCRVSRWRGHVTKPEDELFRTNIHVSSYFLQFRGARQGAAIQKLSPDRTQKHPQAPRVPKRHSTDRWYIAWILGACRMPTVIGGIQTPRDTEAEVQSSIAVCECTMASQRYGA